MRICVGCALVAANVVASSGQAVAQSYYYPPPPGAYYGQPPSAYHYYYGPAPGGYYRSYGPGYPQPAIANPGYPPPAGPYYAPPDRAAGGWIAGLPPEDQPETNQTAELPPLFRRQLVAYATTEPARTIIIDTPHTFLYLVLGHGQALRYGIGVGRTGFTWSGTERISRMSKWPDWHPPKEMIERQPYLPRFTAGGEGNPM